MHTSIIRKLPPYFKKTTQAHYFHRVPQLWVILLNSVSLRVHRTCLHECSVTSNSAVPRTVVHEAPLSIAFPRQEHWSGLPFPSLADLPDPVIEPRSSALQGDSVLSKLPVKQGKPSVRVSGCG